MSGPFVSAHHATRMSSTLIIRGEPRRAASSPSRRPAPFSPVNGNVHTNTMENFWSLLKRGLHGTYISVEPFHLFRYLDEQAFRFRRSSLKRHHSSSNRNHRRLISIPEVTDDQDSTV